MILLTTDTMMLCTGGTITLTLTMGPERVVSYLVLVKGAKVSVICPD